MSNKKKILVWSDAVFAGTGFGTVARNVCQRLHATGNYDIDQLAINYFGDFYDQKKYPYQIIPARLKEPNDPYGTKMFLEAVIKGNYDFVWVMNDSYVVERAAQNLSQVLEKMREANKKVPKLIYYVPVDCHIQSSAMSMVKIADSVVAYSEFAKKEILKTAEEMHIRGAIEAKLDVIIHGAETDKFSEISQEKRRDVRRRLLKVNDDDTFVWVNVNRNSLRKDIAKTILAFSEFKKERPNSLLYIHAAMKDSTGGMILNLQRCCQDLNLSMSQDVIFPANFSPQKPFPHEVLNHFYNAGDGFITTTLGEGWGLTHTDAALTKRPLVVPDNTVFPEQTNNGERAWVYPCQEKVWVDDSGYRPVGRVEDIVATMKKCQDEAKTPKGQEKIDAMYQYVTDNSWDHIGSQWVELFKKVEKRKTFIKKTKAGDLL